MRENEKEKTEADKRNEREANIKGIIGYANDRDKFSTVKTNLHWGEGVLDEGEVLFKQTAVKIIIFITGKLPESLQRNWVIVESFSYLWVFSIIAAEKFGSKVFPIYWENLIFWMWFIHI